MYLCYYQRILTIYMDLMKCQSFIDLQFQFTDKKSTMGKRCSTVTLSNVKNTVQFHLPEPVISYLLEILLNSRSTS